MEYEPRKGKGERRKAGKRERKGTSMPLFLEVFEVRLDVALSNLT